MLQQVIHADVIAGLTNGGGGGDGQETVVSFSSLASAAAATIGDDINLICVIVSGTALLYRRYTFTGPATEFLPLKTNSGTVNWSPAEDFSPLHWGATGDGIVNDRDAITRMIKFMYGTPVTNGNQENAFANQKPFVIDGRQRVYGVGGPVNFGNTGVDYGVTGMVYRLRIHELSLKALPGGNWTGDFDEVNGIPRALMIMAWQFPFSVSNDAFTGMYDITIDHLRLDCNFLTSGLFLKSTYQLEMNGPRIQQIGKNGFGIRTSDHRATENVNGYGARNGALMIRTANIEGKVTESGTDFPPGEDDATMNTTGIDMRGLDFRIDGAIISHVSRSMNLQGRAGQIYNLHPWARLIEIGPDANNLMFCNGYIDYVKFLFKSFKHKFIGMHWIIPSTDTDHGIELQAQNPDETADGLIFCGCTFDHYMDIKFTTAGTGTWAQDKTRKLTMLGCHYGPNNTTAQIERFADMHGIARATGAHWFRNGDSAVGEIRLNANIMHIGKDRGTDGEAIVYLQSGAGDQQNASVRKESGAASLMRVINESGGLSLETSANSIKIWNDGNGTTQSTSWYVGHNRASSGTAELLLVDQPGTPAPTPAGALRAFTSALVELVAQKSGGSLRFSVPGTTGAMLVNNDGTMTFAKDTRSTAGRVMAGARNILGVSDTTVGSIMTNNGQVSTYTESSGAPYIGSRNNDGPLITFGKAGSALNSISVSGSTISYPTSSDERLKEDFLAIDPALIDLLKVYDFAWIDRDGVRGHGVKAQEAEGIIQDMIVKSSVDPEIEGGDFVWGADYSKAVPLLIAAIQDLRARVGALEAAPA